MISYAKVVEPMLPVANGRCLRKPTFRASAIFPAVEMPGISTRLSFLGYWMIKRGIPEVSAVVTVRKSSGEVASRSSQLIKERRVYRVELTDELTGTPSEGQPFRGSIEVEFFSARDMVFAYPAVIVNYYGATFSTFVHTAQRIFNDSDDAGGALDARVPQSGFNIYADGDAEPFFTFVNGLEAVPDCGVAMKFYNHRAETLEHSLGLGALEPYQAITVYPGKEVDLTKFLDHEVGTVTTRFDSRWVFPRIIAGNEQQSLDALRITHTFYDCTDAAALSDYWPEAPEEFHSAALMVPLPFAGEHSTNVYFYPIISPSLIAIDVEIYAEDGAPLGRVENALLIKSPGDRLHRVSLDRVCAALGIVAQPKCSAKIVARPVEGSRLPSRIKMGIDVALKRRELPCNICVSLEPFNAAFERKPGAFRWAPLLADQASATAWLLNGSPAKSYARAANVELTFYRESDEATIVRKVCLPAHGVFTIAVEHDPELQSFFDAKPGWFVATADNPYLSTYYFVEHPSGVVGGDHGF